MVFFTLIFKAFTLTGEGLLFYTNRLHLLAHNAILSLIFKNNVKFVPNIFSLIVNIQIYL
jgi:hypothetical protein